MSRMICMIVVPTAHVDAPSRRISDRSLRFEAGDRAIPNRAPDKQRERQPMITQLCRPEPFSYGFPVVMKRLVIGPWNFHSFDLRGRAVVYVRCDEVADSLLNFEDVLM